MMLFPGELRTLVFLAGLVIVHAQTNALTVESTYTPVPSAPDPPSDSTTSAAATPIPSRESNDLAPSPVDSTIETPPEPEPTDQIDPCYLADPPDWCEEPPPFWHPEVSATGWDDWGEWNNEGIGESGGQGFAPTITLSRPTEQPPAIITTRTPTVVGIRTSVDPHFVNPVSEGEPTRVSKEISTIDEQITKQHSYTQATAGHDESQTEGARGDDTSHGSPLQPTPGPVTPEQWTVDSNSIMPRPQTVPSGNSLLDAIIRELGEPQPGSQATFAAPTIVTPGDLINEKPHTISQTKAAETEGDDPERTRVASAGPITLGSPSTAPAHGSIAVGNVITLGSAVLTLTPGLSTFIGTGWDTTLVAIQTDSASHTAITISSSGTAVTATVTQAPATITLSRTGFEASVTNSAGRGVNTPRPDINISTTSSKGIAHEQRISAGGFTGLVVGLLGYVLVS